MYIGRRLALYWEEKFDEPENNKSTGKDSPKGILFIDPPFADITLSDGFWENLNNKFNTMFDMAEEEELDKSILPKIVDEIKQFSAKKYHNQTGYYEVKVGVRVQPEREEIIKKIAFEEFKHSIDKLCDFLLEANRKNKDVIVML